MTISLGGRYGLVMLFGVAACIDTRTPYDVQRDNPLGPSFWIVPTPSDDDSLLGRTFARPPDTALTLEEQSAPNPCADRLAPRREAQMPNHFENAIASKDTASAALLSTYGFDAEAQLATHLLYKVSTSTRVTRLDTTDYLKCCEDQGCGWGYVQALVFGEGEYAAGIEANAKVQGNYTVLSGGGARAFKVTRTKAVKGYLAAVIVAHDRRQAVQACDASQVWAKTECVPKNLPAQTERLCREGKPEAGDPLWAENEPMLKLFRDQQVLACQWLADHGGPQLTAPPPKARPLATPPQPGAYVGFDAFWSGRLNLNPDGSLARDDGKKGVWLFDGQKLILKWDRGLAEELRLVNPGVYSAGEQGLKLQRAQ